MRAVITDTQIDSFVKWISSVDLDFNAKPKEFDYRNIVPILIDAVLSMNRQYESFVVPRVNAFERQYPEICSLRALHTLITGKGEDGFREVWNYNHPDRVRILKDLVEFFLAYKDEGTFQTDRDAMMHWANTGIILPVKGFAYKTTQYLRMMLGVSTVKPDIHVRRAAEDAVGNKLSDINVVKLIELAAVQIGKDARDLDYAIWKHLSAKNPSEQ